MKNHVFVLVIVVFTSFALCTVSQGEEYKSTDLPFKAADLVLEKGGVCSEKVEKDGVKPYCSGISLKSLTLGDSEIPLKSTAVTSDCMIETRDYGNLRIKINFATYSYSIHVTPKQEKLFKKLASSRQPVPADAPCPWKIERANVVSQEPSGNDTLVTVRVPLGRPLAPQGPFYLTPQSPFVFTEDGVVHFWDGWMNTTPTSEDPVLWRPLTPRSVELEFLRSANARPGEGTLNIKSIADTKVAREEVESSRRVRFTDEGAGEITLLYSVPSSTIAVVGIIVWDISCRPAARERGLSEGDLKRWAQDALGLHQGETAYVRVAGIATQPSEDRTPPGTALSLRFRDQVILVKQSEDKRQWLISKDSKEAWISSVELTKNLKELSFLQKINRVPLTTSWIFVDEQGFLRVSGPQKVMFSVGGTSGTLSSPERPEGASPERSRSTSFAIKGNALFLDSGIVNLKQPYIAIGCKEKEFPLSTDAMYYCTSEEEGGCFECIDLRVLSKCGE